VISAAISPVGALEAAQARLVGMRRLERLAHLRKRGLGHGADDFAREGVAHFDDAVASHLAPGDPELLSQHVASPKSMVCGPSAIGRPQARAIHCA
jgi:hypothetical protein